MTTINADIFRQKYELTIHSASLLCSFNEYRYMIVEQPEMREDLTAMGIPFSVFRCNNKQHRDFGKTCLDFTLPKD